MVIFSETTEKESIKKRYSALDSENLHCAAMSAMAEFLFECLNNDSSNDNFNTGNATWRKPLQIGYNRPVARLLESGSDIEEVWRQKMNDFCWFLIYRNNKACMSIIFYFLYLDYSHVISLQLAICRYPRGFD